MKQQSPIRVRDLIEYVLCIVSAFYAAYRTLLVFPGRQLALFWILGIVGSLLLTFQALTSRGMLDLFPLYSVLIVVSGLYISLLLYFGGALLILDILYLILRYGAGLDVSNRIFAGISLLVSLLITLYGAIHAMHLKTVPVSVPSSKVSKPYKIVQLSDLHIGAVIGPIRIRWMVRRVNALKPDLVVITGDLVNKRRCAECRRLTLVEQELREIECPVVAVSGNHDPARTDPDFAAFLAAAGITLVDETSASFGPVSVFGRAGCMEMKDTRGALPSLASDSSFTIVLDHNPGGIDEAVSAGADLVLCGHTHAGQFFPCTVMTRKYYGKVKNHGVGHFGKTTSVVSSGTGCFQCPVRVGTDAEVVEITLVPGRGSE